VIALLSGAGSSNHQPFSISERRYDSPACFFFLNLVSVIGRKKVHSSEYCLQCAHSASRPIASSGNKISHLIFFVRCSLAHHHLPSHITTETYTGITCSSRFRPFLLFLLSFPRTSLLPLLLSPCPSPGSRSLALTRISLGRE